MANLEAIMIEVYTERLRQDQLKKEGRFAATCADSISDGIRLSVLSEEVGEVSHNVNEIFNEWGKSVNRGTSIESNEMIMHYKKEMRKELVQVAAVAVAWIEGLDLESKT